MIEYKVGDIFNSSAAWLVNPVNCVGVMGAGLAAQFAQRYPIMLADYRYRCERSQVQPGAPYPYEGIDGRVLIFPTKNHWKNPSKLEWIRSGLEHFADWYQAWEVDSIAFPPLGCGHGGLDWSVVSQIMKDILTPLPIPIQIYILE